MALSVGGRLIYSERGIQNINGVISKLLGPANSSKLTTICFSLNPPDGQNPNRLKRGPLLYFPYQRQFIVSNESGFAFDKYARAVWKRATELISKTTEIHVIGYSVSGIDRGPMLEMLGQARSCRRLIIQSPNSDEICSRLRLESPRLRSLVETAPFKF
jgi:hypothetical protein